MSVSQIEGLSTEITTFHRVSQRFKNENVFIPTDFSSLQTSFCLNQNDPHPLYCESDRHTLIGVAANDMIIELNNAATQNQTFKRENMQTDSKSFSVPTQARPCITAPAVITCSFYYYLQFTVHHL